MQHIRHAGDGQFVKAVRAGLDQRFRPALMPLGDARPAWDIIGDTLARLGAPATAARAEHWFRALTGAVPAFAGLTYQTIGDGGAMVAPAVTA